jgi:hypothetical protein
MLLYFLFSIFANKLSNCLKVLPGNDNRLS